MFLTRIPNRAAALSAAPILPVAADTGVDGRVLTVGPATNLTQGVVQVSWTGFRPTRRIDNVYAVNVAQCTAAPQTLADCYTAARYPSIGDGSIVTGVVTKTDGTGATVTFGNRAGGPDRQLAGASVAVRWPNPVFKAT